MLFQPRQPTFLSFERRAELAASKLTWVQLNSLELNPLDDHVWDAMLEK